MRINHKLKLIDLDACVSYSNMEEHSCTKYSSAYVPPELLYATNNGVVVRCPNAKNNTANASRRNSNSNTPVNTTLNSTSNATIFSLQAILENSNNASPTISEKEREKEKERDKEREKEREKEKEKDKEKEIQKEIEREKEKEKEKEREKEKENGGNGIGMGSARTSPVTIGIPGLKISRDKGGGRGINNRYWNNYDDEESKDTEINGVKKTEAGNTNSVRVIIENIDNYSRKLLGDTTEIVGHSAVSDNQECNTNSTPKRGLIPQLSTTR